MTLQIPLVTYQLARESLIVVVLPLVIDISYVYFFIKPLIIMSIFTFIYITYDCDPLGDIYYVA